VSCSRVGSSWRTSLRSPERLKREREPPLGSIGNWSLDVVVPAVASLLALTRPPCACMMERTIASPSGTGQPGGGRAAWLSAA
jgi:hypothetical protein